MARWGAADDSKLAELFRAPRNGVNPKDLSVAAVKAVHKAHFSSFDYNNFAPLYRAKARAWSVGKTLEGHRKSESFISDDLLATTLSHPFVSFYHRKPAGKGICTR